MSKSDPDSAIFMEDSKDDIIRKINAAYCPLKPEVEKASADQSEIRLVEDDLKNPCLDYIEHIVMSLPEATFTAAGTTYQVSLGFRHHSGTSAPHRPLARTHAQVATTTTTAATPFTRCSSKSKRTFCRRN